jgi:hypothetical protein
VAKGTGLGDQLYADGVNLSGDTGSLSRVGGGPAPHDLTGIDKYAFERKGGLRDGGLEWAVWMNLTTAAAATATDPAGAHEVLSSLPTSDRIVSYLNGQIAGNPGASCVAKQINYDWSRANDGALTGAVSAQANGFGIDWGVQLTNGRRTDTTATSPATGLDLTTASTAFGWQAYLHVFSVTGTSVTVTLQDSADNSAFAGLTGAAFTAATTKGAQRLQGGRTATVRRYVRAITTGTFTEAIFAVVFTRNTSPVEF